MPFIDSTYFTGEIGIAGAANESGLTQAIAQYEKEILINLLGYELYKTLMADLSSGEPQSDRFTSLVNGAEFTHTFQGKDYLMKWEGLKNADKLSLIAHYTFFKYVERSVTQHFGAGIGQMAKGQDWERTNPAHKLCATWEKMREMYGKLSPECKLYYDRPLYAGNLPGVFNMDPSAYNFLYAKQADYPEWVFTPLWNLNAFGI